MHELHQTLIDLGGRSLQSDFFKSRIKDMSEYYELEEDHEHIDYFIFGKSKNTYKHFSTKEEAENYLYSLNSWDNSNYCTYRMKRSAKYVKLQERLDAEMHKLVEYEKAHSVKKFKATTVGCPNCKSKLAKGYLNSEECPLCGTDLRGKTTLDTIERYKDNIKNLRKEMAAEAKEMEKGRASKYDIDSILYLLSVDTHC